MIADKVYERVDENIDRLSPLQRREIRDLFIPHKKSVFLIALIALFQAAFQAAILLTMKPMLDNSIKSSNLDSILFFGGLLLILIIFHGACAILVSRMSARVSSDIAEEFRAELFRRVVMTDELDQAKDTSGMMIRLMSDVDNIQRMVTDFLRVWLYTFFLTVGLIVVSFLIGTQIGLVFLTATVIVYLTIIFAAKTEFRFRKEIIDRFETMIRVFRGFVKGGRKRRYLGHMDDDHDKFRELSGSYSKVCDDTRIRAYKRSSLARLLFTGSICGIIALILIFNHTLTVNLTNALLFIQMALLLEASLSLYPFMIESIPTASASLDKIKEAVRFSDDTKDAIPEDSDSEYIIRSYCERYPSIIRGQETSIITMADAGAWDFVQMITGTRNAAKGMLYLEDTDVSKISHSYITKKIAYAGPSALTIDRTVSENIDIWRGIDKERISEVCRNLSIDLPLDFEILRSGSNISGGDAFKISMARALVSDADIYIFENTFVLLDHDVIKQIVRYIRRTLSGRTVIFISPSAVISDSSENIVMISEGKVICSGTGDAVRSDALYRELRIARRCSFD